MKSLKITRTISREEFINDSAVKEVVSGFQIGRKLQIIAENLIEAYVIETDPAKNY